MKKIIHRASDRGHADHGWLDTHHTFSFANYYNPDQMNFGVLRVLNDDIVEPGRGFGQHPHADMEIISIPLEGALTHRDTMGHAQAIRTGDVQVMSAGTGLQHSEYNESESEHVNFLQLWIFPKSRGVEPRYDQKSFDPEARKNNWQQIVKPEDAEGEGLWIHQDAYMHLADMDEGANLRYAIRNEGNGVYFFILEGEIEVNGELLRKRDGIGLWETDEVLLKADTAASVLAVEGPMG